MMVLCFFVTPCNGTLEFDSTRIPSDFGASYMSITEGWTGPGNDKIDTEILEQTVIVDYDKCVFGTILGMQMTSDYKNKVH